MWFVHFRASFRPKAPPISCTLIMLRSLTMLTLLSTALGLAVKEKGDECCGYSCSSDDDCAMGLFCCPNHNECMDDSTKSTIGPNCDACNPPSSPAPVQEKKCSDKPK